MFFGIFEKRSANADQRPNLRDPKTWPNNYGGSISHSGEVVNEVNAMEITAFSSALTAVATAFAQLPIHIEKTRGGKTTRDDESNEGSFIRDGGTINEDGMTTVDWLMGKILHYYTKGRASTLIERAMNGSVLNLWPLDPDRLAVMIRRLPATDNAPARDQRFYEYTDPNGEKIAYETKDVIDLVRLPDPVTLRPSPVVMNRHTIGLALAAEKYAARTFKSGMVPLQLVCTLPPESINPEQLEAAWNIAVQGLQKAAETDAQFFCNVPGFELKEIGIRPGDLQLLELRKFLIIEIARVFNLPPIFLQDLSTGTFSNTEQQSAVLVKNTLMPIISQFEAQMNAKFVGKQQKLRVNVDGFLRADYATRQEGHRTAVHGGFLTANEARALEGREPLEGGDQLLIQGATVPLALARELAEATIKKANTPAPAPQSNNTQEPPVKTVEEDAQ